MDTLPPESRAFSFPRFWVVCPSFPDKERRDAMESMEEWKDVQEESLVADVWLDIDSNRTYDVLYVRPEPRQLSDNQDEDEAFDSEEVSTICGFLLDVVDHLPPNTRKLILSHCGRVLWTGSGPSESTGYDLQPGYKPSLHQYRLPRPLPTLFRSQLTLVDRLYLCVDKVTYPGSPSPWNEQQHKTVVFKYPRQYGALWHEIQTLARLPADHPHMINIDCIILEELTGLGVIGFTTRFIDAPTMEAWAPSRPFKLRYLRGLLGVLDELHLQYGIHHRDLHDRNLLVDPATDKLVLIDFGLAAHPDSGGYHSEWNDFKAAVIFLHYRITRAKRYDGKYPASDEEEASLLLSRERWAKHPDVVLDHDADVFYDELVGWLKKRGHWRRIHRLEQGEPESQPALPPAPFQIRIPAFSLNQLVKLNDVVESMDLCRASGGLRREHGRPALAWHRPTKSEVDPSRRLLATGRYADEEEAVSGKAIAVPDPKLGFPQPPVFPPPAPGPRKTWKRKRVSGVSRLISEDV